MIIFPEPPQGIITNGQGEFLIYRVSPAGQPDPLSVEEYEEIFEGIEESRLVDDRHLFLKEKIQDRFGDCVHIGFVPRTLYELLFLRECILQDIQQEKCTHAQGTLSLEAWKGNAVATECLYQERQERFWQLGLFEDQDYQSQFSKRCDADDRIDHVKRVAARLNQTALQLIKELGIHSRSHQKSTVADGFTFEQVKHLQREVVNFFIRLHNPDSNLYKTTLKIEDPKQESITREFTRLGKFPLGITCERDKKIVSRAIQLECSASAVHHLILYRGAEFSSDSVSKSEFGKPNVHSISYGTGLFAGALYDRGATPFYYMRKPENDAQAVLIPRDKQQAGETPFHLFQVHPLIQLKSKGEIFHARTKVYQLDSNDIVTGIYAGPFQRYNNYGAVPEACKTNWTQEGIQKSYRAFRDLTHLLVPKKYAKELPFSVLPDALNGSINQLVNLGFKLKGFNQAPGEIIAYFGDSQDPLELHFDLRTQTQTLQVSFATRTAGSQTLLSMVKEMSRLGLWRLVEEPVIDQGLIRYSLLLNQSQSLQELSEQAKISNQVSPDHLINFFSRIIHYLKDNQLSSYFLNLFAESPSEDLIELLYTSIGFLCCEFTGKSLSIQRLLTQEECLTILFGSPLSLNHFEDFIYDVDDLFPEDERKIVPEVRDILIRYVQKFSKDGSDQEKLASFMIQFYLGKDEHKLDENFREFLAFPPDQILLPFRIFLNHEFGLAGCSTPDVQTQVEEVLSNEFYLEVWERLDFWGPMIEEIAEQLPLQLLSRVLKTVNFSKKNGQIIFNSLYHRVSAMKTLTEEDFQAIRKIYMDAFLRKKRGLNPVDWAVGIAIACYKKGFFQALSDAFIRFSDLPLPKQNLLWKNVLQSQEIDTKPLARIVASSAKDNTAFFSALNFLAQDQDPRAFEEMIGTLLLERKISDKGEDLLKTSAKQFHRADFHERFLHAALDKMLGQEIDEEDLPKHQQWIDPLVFLLRTTNLSPMSQTLQQIIQKGTTFDLLYKILASSYLPEENVVILRSLICQSADSYLT